MTERYMADAISCGAFPGGVTIPGKGSRPLDLRAGYINGNWPTATQCGTEVSIDVNGSAPQADVLDIETGDATPDTAPGWVRDHNGRNTGFPAVLYCNRSTAPAVANALDAAGLNNPGRDFWWWLATLDGTTAVPDMTGVAAVQAFSASFFPENIDCSVVYADAFKGAAAPPPPPLAPEIHGEIAVKYHTTPGLADLLGPPATPELPCPDGVGRFNHFALNNGSIYWTPQFGAFAVWGSIKELWKATGWERGPLGYPQSDEVGCAGFDRWGVAASWRASFFEHGAITWTPGGGAVTHLP